MTRTRNIAGACAIAALIALIICWLGCIYPAAWSPDSQKVVFPVFGKQGIEALVMTDLSCEPIREVARVEPKKAALSAAAWSPDGKWIAYFKFEPNTEPGQPEPPKMGRAKRLLSSLILQDAASGKEQCILKSEARRADDAREANAAYGPQWLSDSKGLAIRSTSEQAHGLLVLDLSGKVQREIPLEGKLPLRTASLSPDGLYVAYLGQPPEEAEEQAGVYLYDVREKKALRVAAFALPDQVELWPPPAWSPDSRSLYFATQEKLDEGGKVGLVKCHTIKTAKTRTVWEKPKAKVYRISVSAGTGLLAVDYADEVHDSLAIDVVSPVSGEATPVHFGGDEQPALSTAISPDGKWVAFCPSVQREVWLPAIVSSDSGALNFFVADPETKKYIPGIVRERLKGALRAAGAEEQLKAAGEGLSQMPPEEAVKKALEILDRIAGEQKAAIFREAIAYHKVALCIKVMEAEPPEVALKLSDAAAAQLEEFLKAYPVHPLAPELKEKLNQALAEKPEEAEAQPVQAE